MKKLIVALALIAGLAVASTASAQWGRGGRGHGGYCNCPQMQGPIQGQMLSQPDQATQEKIKKFFSDTQEMHKQMVMKEAEKQALMQSDKPDPQAVAKVAGEMFDLRTAIHAKADQAGVGQYVGRGMGRGMGHGWRGGPGAGMGRGYGMMNRGMMNDAPAADEEPTNNPTQQ